MVALAVPFSFKWGVLQTVSDPISIIEQNITDVLMTHKYERVMMPTYGANTDDLLYENFGALSIADFKEEAIAAINEQLTNGSVVDLSISKQAPNKASPLADDGTALYITAYYLLRGDTTTKSLSLSFMHPSAFTASTPF